jgi:hypothetical protein
MVGSGWSFGFAAGRLMNWKHYLLFFVLGAILMVGLGIIQKAPGYMDAEYYYSMGLRIANDKVLTEPFVWNFLFDQRALPHPGFTYWQPLPALIAAGGLFIFGGSGFLSAKILFLLAYSFVPVITSSLAWKLTEKKEISILAGVFALFPVFYSPFIGVTDSFGLMMFLGGVYLIAHEKRDKKRYVVLLGLASGLIHLARAEGLIWLGLGLLSCILEKDDRVTRIVLLMSGYFLVMGPWFVRNLIDLGEFLPSGTGRMFWLTEYNDLFVFQPESLNFGTWRDQGAIKILNNILQATTANLKTMIFVQGQLIMAPLAFYGFWNLRKEKTIQIGGTIFLAIISIMTVVFPFAGGRGGFFHAGAGIQPLIWVMSAMGFDLLIEVAVKRRNWHKHRAFAAFGSSLALVFLLATGYIFYSRVYGEESQDMAWTSSERVAVEIAAELDELDIPDSTLVMINNPPGFYSATGRSSIVIPSGSIDSIVQAAGEFGAKVLILEANHAAQLDDLYDNPSGTTQLNWIHSSDGIHYFLIPKNES